MNFLLFRGRNSRHSNQRNQPLSSSVVAHLPQRQPLAPHTILDPQASQSPEQLPTLSPTQHSPGDLTLSDTAKLASQSLESQVDTLPVVPNSPKINRSAYVDRSDLYTHNSLNSFSFGAAKSSPVLPTRSIDPFSKPRDEGDSEDLLTRSDITPRPSVFGPEQSLSHDHASPTTSRPRNPSPHEQSPKAVRSPRSRSGANIDVTSFHSLGTSSASASVSSLSSSSASNSRISRASKQPSTPHTSSNDLSTDDEIEHRHPIPTDLNHVPTPTRAVYAIPGSSLTNSEEEDFEDDSDFYHDIDISSEVNEGSDHGNFLDYSSVENHVFSNSPSWARRGSAAMAIPGASADRTFSDSRNREDSVATVRRPSKSLEDFRGFIGGGSGGGPAESPSIAVAPISVPESEGDWRDLRKRSMQREKDATTPSMSTAKMKSAENKASTPQTATKSPANGSDATEGFDLNWTNSYAFGIVDLNGAEMSEIVGGNVRSPQSRIWGNRRSSTVSNADAFVKGLRAWDEEAYEPQKKTWTFHREKEEPRRKSQPEIKGRSAHASFSSYAKSGGSSNGGQSLNKGVKDDSRLREKSYGKDKERDPAFWKGMPLDSEEVWWNDLTGKFKVIRKNHHSIEAGKPPQRRINIRHCQSSGSRVRDMADGPQATIHKHSTATAFSISRHYRYKEPATKDPLMLIPPDSRHIPVPVKKNSSSMILLAPRRVQEAFTSTNTTRKLESHGLLDNSGRGSPKDWERMKKEKEREKLRKEKEKKKKKSFESKSKERTTETIHSPSASQSMPSLKITSASDSSRGSVTQTVSTDRGVERNANASSSSSRPSTSTHDAVSQQAETSATWSSIKTEMNPSLLSNSRPVQRGHRSRRDILDINEDDDDYDEDRPPTRTPHGEAFGTIPPEELELLVSRHEDQSRGLFGLRKNRNNGPHHLSPHNVLDSSFVPPWPSNLPRHSAEHRQIVVDDLNNSFQDVGLLPTASEMKANANFSRMRKYDAQSHRLKQLTTDAMETDIFQEVPHDSLYMLLPLWPGNTDIYCRRKYPFRPPHIPVDKRQYLLLYYKNSATPPGLQTNSKNKGESKKRSRTSPISSHDSVRRDDHSVLLNTFHISARVVAYSDLQGYGIRIPDEGLAVMGPLEEAYKSMPTSIRERGLHDWLIGFCQSRESGIEFYPEGLVRMGLCRSEAPVMPRLMDEAMLPPEPQVRPTPIGRAVLEMAWMGGMALTSFG